MAANAAEAKGRFPQSNEIVFSPSDPNQIVVRTTYGILQSRDNGATWQYLCEDALGIPPEATIDPALALTQTNTLLAAVTSEIRGNVPYVGLDVSTDLGCTWNCIDGPLANQAVSDLVVRPDAPDVALAVTSTYRPLDAGGGSSSQVFQSTDDGAQWSPLGGSFDPSVTIHSIDVARSDSSRLYVSGSRGVGQQTTASLFVSMDQGAHWTENPLPQFDPIHEEFLWIAAVDPMNADRVYLRSNAPVTTGGKSRLYVSDDAGVSFALAMEFQVPPPIGKGVTGLGEMLGFALSSDGSKVYAGTAEGGLYMASATYLKFHPVNSSIAVQCLATRGDELWACSDAKSGFIVGVSTDDGAHFCPKMREVWSVAGPLSCGAGAGATLACGAISNGSQCQSQFTLLCESYSTNGLCSADCAESYPAQCRDGLGDAGGTCDAGAYADAGAGSDAGANPSPGSSTRGVRQIRAASSGCNCTTPGERGRLGRGLLALLTTLGVAVRRWRVALASRSRRAGAAP